MAPKKKGGKKGGKKKKGPAFYTAPEDTQPFGFLVHDIVRTPVGLTGTVIGVKYDDPENKETGRLWVEYPGGKQSPLEPRLGAGFIGTLGYRRAPEAEHIRRDVDAFNLKLRVEEDRRWCYHCWCCTSPLACIVIDLSLSLSLSLSLLIQEGRMNSEPPHLPSPVSLSAHLHHLASCLLSQA